METKSYSITKERIQRMYNSAPISNTWYYKVPKSELLWLIEIMSEMLDAYEELKKQNTILQNWISLI